MFTGIVQGIAVVEEVTAATGLSTFAISLPDNSAEGITIGGVCGYQWHLPDGHPPGR